VTRMLWDAGEREAVARPVDEVAVGDCLSFPVYQRATVVGIVENVGSRTVSCVLSKPVTWPRDGSVWVIDPRPTGHRSDHG
jgi:hypothetical protein